jgi:hypothetical protein
MTLEVLGEQRKHGLAVQGENWRASSLDTLLPRQYFPGSNWHSFYESAKGLINR